MGQPVSNMKVKAALFVSLRACSLHVFPQKIPHYLETVKAKPAVIWLLISLHTKHILKLSDESIN